MNNKTIASIRHAYFDVVTAARQLVQEVTDDWVAAGLGPETAKGLEALEEAVSLMLDGADTDPITGRRLEPHVWYVCCWVLPEIEPVTADYRGHSRSDLVRIQARQNLRAAVLAERAIRTLGA